MQTVGIKSVKKLGIQKSLDFEVDHPDHNFYANGLVTSNSHSISYSVIAAWSVYLKFKYPQEFFLASLLVEGKGDVPFVERELHHFGMQLLSPDIIKSENDFSIEGKDIRFGIGGIKGLSDAALLRIGDFINKKTANKFEVFNAANQAKVNSLVFCNIINAGALNSLGANRSLLVLEVKIWNQLSDREKNFCLLNGARYNFDLIAMLKDYENWVDSSMKKFAPKRLETIRRDTAKYLEEWRKNKQFPEFTAYINEKRLLGYSYSHTLKDVFVKNRPELVNIQEVKNLDQGYRFTLVAEVQKTIKGISKKGNTKFEVFVSDETGEFKLSFTGKDCDRWLAEGIEPEEGDIIIAVARKGEDIGWLNSLEAQKVYEV